MNKEVILHILIAVISVPVVLIWSNCALFQERYKDLCSNQFAKPKRKCDTFR